MALFNLSVLEKSDPQVFASIKDEYHRQANQIELIASENIASRAVTEAQGSVLTNKYAEGYPSKRYYGGCIHVDVAEQLAIDRAKQLFACEYVNVQPHSGAQANAAVFLALLKPDDTILGMSLSAGGHLTHGARPTMSGKWFNAIQYGVREDNGLIDYDAVEKLALEHQPKLIIAGASSYSRTIDFAKFRAIADKVDAYLLVDMAHYSGLVAAGEYPSPLPHAHVVTTTTHKTLRGPRGGMILSNHIDLGKKFNSAVFPGVQGGPLMHVIAAKAVAFAEALEPAFKQYAKQIIANARALSTTLLERGFDIVSGGTDSHIVLVDMRPKNVTGKVAEHILEEAGMTCNKNGIPFDPQPPAISSGIRLGTAAATTRGFNEGEFVQVGNWVADVLEAHGTDSQDATVARVLAEINTLCAKFPIY